MAIDRTDGIGKGNIYACWNGTWSICSPNNFTRSIDGGLTYEKCSYIEQKPYWGILTVGNDGELYVCGAYREDFIVLRSTTAQDPTQEVTWDLATPVSLWGTIASSDGPNPGGLLGQAWIAVDHSMGPTRGNIYLLCSVNPVISDDPLDVNFSSSTDGGITWSLPTRVNDDLSSDNWQWFGTMSVAPNGRIDVVWLDTRDSDNFNSSLYFSYSKDAGVTWSRNTRLSESFDPHIGWPQQRKLGDYFHMISDESGANLAWAATFNGEQDVYYSRITIPGEACQITILSPHEDEVWCVGESEEITWISENSGDTVKIEFSINDGSSWQAVADSTPDDGVHPWTVPDIPSTHCLIRICDTSGLDCCVQSYSTFQICECRTLMIVTESLPDGTKGCFYEETVDAVGGCSPFFWSIRSGALPESLNIDTETGLISGKPTEIGSFDFTVQAIDAIGDTAANNFSFQITEYANFKGDANGDCSIDVADVMNTVNILLAIVEPTEDQFWRADTNGPSGTCDGDGIVNILDIIKIVNMTLGLDECP